MNESYCQYRAIGVGTFMARQHLPNIMKNQAIRLHTLCDLDEKLLKQRAQEYKPMAVTTKADDIFSNPEIDAVLVGTRSRQHGRFILKAARSGKYVYAEKPVMRKCYQDLVFRQSLSHKQQ